MEFFEYLNIVLTMTAWMLQNLDLTMGGLALLVLLTNGVTGAERVPMIIMAVIGLGIRAARIIYKKLNA